MSAKQTKGKTVTNVGASVRARLLNIAQKSNRDYNHILIQYAQERLLYRFSISHYRDNFILKGALLFLTYDMPHHRPTKDIEYLAQAVKNDLAVETKRHNSREITAKLGIFIQAKVIFPLVRKVGSM